MHTVQKEHDGHACVAEVVAPAFIYFDLGKVLVDFSVERMCRQIGETAGLAAERVAEILFEDQLQKRAELGEASDREFFEAFCQLSGTRPDYDALVAAASDIFEINCGVVPIVAQLAQAGHRMGVLSNTCRSHWEHCLSRYTIVAEAFSVHTLSFEVGACKPDAAIYQAAAEAAGVAPEEIFFVDDIADNVAGAAAAGFDAVQYTSAAQVAADLRRRGVRFNY